MPDGSHSILKLSSRDEVPLTKAPKRLPSKFIVWPALCMTMQSQRCWRNSIN